MKKMNLGRHALAVLCATMMAVSLAAPAAFADSESKGDAQPAPAKAYAGTTYTVSVFSGNQGTLAQGTETGQTQLTFADVAPGTAFSFEGISIEVPEDSKYYAKGIRLAALDNVRSDKNRDGATKIGEETIYYARPNADGVMVDQQDTLVDGVPAPGVAITEDMDFVVAYGIMANRVAYTVNYVDAETSEALRESETFFGDIGDTPATAPRYIENYLPQATLVLLTLSEDESANVVEFRYTRLADNASTELQPDGAVNITVNPPQLPEGGQGTGTGTGTGNTIPGAYTTVVTPGAADDADAGMADGGAREPGAGLVTPDGEELLDADGNPLAAPGVERIDDDENALSAGEQLGNQVPAPNTAWIPWAIAAGVIAVLIAIILVIARRNNKPEPEE